MSRWKKFRVLLIVLSAATFIACGGGGSSTPTNDPASSSSSGSSSNTSSGTGSTSIPQLSAGDQVLFLARSSSSSDVMNIGGQSIALEAGSGYIYRYVPSIPSLERFDRTYNATNNYSCSSAGAQKPYTSAQTLFNIEVCPSYSGGYSNVDVEQVNLNSGELIGNTCRLVLSGTSQVSINMTYLNGYLYYVDSSGDLKRGLANCSTPVTILTSGDGNNTGTFYGINGQLVSVQNDVFYNDRYLIRLHDSDTGTITQSLGQISVSDSSNTEYRFFEGDDALYWAVYHRSSYSLSIYRYVPAGTVESIYSTTLSDAMIGIAIDASGGEVLISYEYVAARTSGGYATAWNEETRLYDIALDSFTTLDLNNNFEQSLQYMVIQ